jgi:hypothetical protein
VIRPLTVVLPSLALVLAGGAAGATCDDCVDYSADPTPALLGSLDVTDDPSTSPCETTSSTSSRTTST